MFNTKNKLSIKKTMNTKRVAARSSKSRQNSTVPLPGFVLWKSVLHATAMTALTGHLNAATVNFASVQTTQNGTWRTAGVVKAYDLDGDNVLGTDGYWLVGNNGSQSVPSYVDAFTKTGSIYGGNGSYYSVDNPANPGNTTNPGTTTPASNSDVLKFTFTGAPPSTVRLGVMIDALDNAYFNPSSVIIKLNGSVVGTVVTSDPIYRDRNPDWVFWDVENATAGDEMVITGVSPSNQVTLTAFSFDNVSAPPLIWNAAANGNWSDDTWTEALPVFPDGTVKSRIDTGFTVTVDGSRSTQQLTLENQGKIIIPTGNSLPVSGSLSVAPVAAGSGVTLADDSLLSALSGSIDSASVSGDVTINVTGALGTLTIPSYIASAASSLSKGGAGMLALTNAANVPDPLANISSLTLGGGKLKLTGAESQSSSVGLIGSIFLSTPDNDVPMNLDGSGYASSSGRVFTGDKPNTVLALASEAGQDVVLTGEINNWNGFPQSSYGDHFVTAFSGTFTPAESGDHNFRWDNDDRGLMYIDMDNNGVFDASDKVGNYDWNSNGTKNLTAGVAYSVIFMAQEHGGGESVNWMFTTPSLSERRVNPSDPAQTGMWNAVQTTNAAINLTGKTVQVNANTELQLITNTAPVIPVVNISNGVLTLGGSAPSFTISSTNIDGAATTTGYSSGKTVMLGPIAGNNATTSFIKDGTGNLFLNAGNTGLNNATFDVRAGKLNALVSSDLGGSSAMQLSGGSLLLSSSGGNQAYDIATTVTQNCGITVGKTTGGANGPLTVTLGSPARLLTVQNNKTLTLNATDNYSLNLNNSLVFQDNAQMNVSGAGVNINIVGASTLSMGNGSSLTLDSGTMTTDHPVSVHNLNLNGGALALNGAGANKSLHVNGTLTVNNAATNLDLTGGALLTTAGNATINLVNGTITTDSALSVGNLTVESGGTLNRTGVGANGDVSVGDRLRLVNKNFNTTGSTLSVGNRIELENSTLNTGSNLSLNSIWLNSNSVLNPGAITTVNDIIEVYNGATVNFTGKTLNLTNRFRLENNATLIIDNPLTLNGTLEVYSNSLVDFKTHALTTNYQNVHINGNSELKAPNSGSLDINYLQIWDGGKLNVPGVRIRDAVWLGSRTTAAFNITEENPGKRLEAHQGGVDDYGTNRHVYLTGTNAYTGETQMHDATVLVAQQGVGLPNASMVRFYNGVLGTNGVFAREIGDGIDGGGLGRVRFSSWGGFAAFGGSLTVSLITANPGNRIDWSSYDNGFNDQGLRLGASFDTHDVTITNPIYISQGIHIEARSSQHLGILSGNLTGNGDFNKNEGKGTIVLSGNNSGYSGNIHIRRGALDVGTNGVGLGGTNVVYLRHDTGDAWNWNASIIQANGTLNKNIGQDAGDFFWDQEGGGFAARGGNLSVTLEGGATLDWGNDNAGFNGRQLMFGSTTADSVVTLTNNLNGANGYRRITVIDNPNSANDKAVLLGALTDFRGFELHGNGVLEIPHDFTDIHDDQLRTYETSRLRVLGNLRAGTEDTSADPRYLPSGAFNNLEVNSGNLYVTGNVQANYFYSGGAADSQVQILGNVALRHRWIHDRGTAHVGGNLSMGEDHLNVREGGTMIIDGNARIGAPNGNSADRNVYVESGGAITFNGPLQASYLQSNGQNGTRSSSVRINSTAMIGNNGSGNVYFNGENMNLGGVLDGSGTVNANYVEFHNRASLGGTLTLNVNDRIEFHGSNSVLAPGNSAGTLTVNGNLQLNGGAHYECDGGDLVDSNVGTLTAGDGWNLDLMSGGAQISAGGSMVLFTYENLGSFDLTPNIDVSALIEEGWLPGNFDTGTLTLTADAGVVTLHGLQSSALPQSAFESWIAGKGLTGNDALPGANPDGDDLNNLGEFAFNGNPDDGSDQGMLHFETKDNNSDSMKELTFTVAVRRSNVGFAADGNNAQSATSAIDGVLYTIEADTDLQGVWNSAVTYLGKSDNPPAGSGLGSLSGTDWEYRTFSSFNGLPNTGFIRGKAVEAP